MDELDRGHEMLGQSIENGRLELISILGVGAYGVVYLAREQCHTTASTSKQGSGAPCPCLGGSYAPHGQLVAVKCLSQKNLEPRQRLFQRREIALHALLSTHPGVARLHRVFEERDHVFLVMDYLPGGDLFSMISDTQRYVGDDELVRNVFLQIVDTVAYCHSMGVYHRDLKPENILCSKDGTRVVVADFGLATTEAMSKDFGCGSTFYLSPECQGGLSYPVDAYSSAQADVWSLGVILANLACVRNPWRQATLDDETFCAYLEDKSMLGRILPLSSAAEHILAGCFAENPKDRITISQLRELVVAAPRFSTLPQRISVRKPSMPNSMPVTPVTPLHFALEQQASTPRLIHSREEHAFLGHNFPSSCGSSSAGSHQWLPLTPPLSPLETHGATWDTHAHGHQLDQRHPKNHTQPSHALPDHVHDLSASGHRHGQPFLSCNLSYS